MRSLVTLLLLFAAACSQPSAPAADGAAGERTVMQLTDDEAGRIVRRAIDAAGGWEAWQSHRDAEFVATLTIFTPIGEVASETIFLHKLLLHRPGVRVDSIGLIEPVTFGFDGQREWMLRGGRAVTSVTGTAFTRFHAMTDAFWFGLPFALAERPTEMLSLGPERDGEKHWQRVRVASGDAAAAVDWMVLYFDAQTGLIDKIHAHVNAEFLTHSLWVGRLEDYREVGGLRKERRRFFYPADVQGRVIGALAAEELVEHVELDRGWPLELFTAPLAAGGGSPAG